MKTYAILLASGIGARIGGDIPKQFITIAGKTILEHSLNAFESHNLIDAIVLVIHPDYKGRAEEIVSAQGFKKVVSIIYGGKERKDSSYNGILEVDRLERGKECNLLIHDVARPCVKSDIITASINSLKSSFASVPIIELSDTVLQVAKEEEGFFVDDLLERSNLRLVQTPQAFKLSLIKKAYEISKKDTIFTDDASLIIKYKLAKVCLVNGDIDNIKITYPRDFFLAEKFFKKDI